MTDLQDLTRNPEKTDENDLCNSCSVVFHYFQPAAAKNTTLQLLSAYAKHHYMQNIYKECSLLQISDY